MKTETVSPAPLPVNADVTQRIVYGPRFLATLADRPLTEALERSGVVPAVVLAPVDALGRLGHG